MSSSKRGSGAPRSFAGGKKARQLNQGDAVVTLAWAIIVEAALLSEKLKQDIRESAVSKGFAVTEPMAQDFFMPNPSQEARRAFNLYVQCRWPIHVFSLDPDAQEQNIASTFSMRRVR